MTRNLKSQAESGGVTPNTRYGRTSVGISKDKELRKRLEFRSTALQAAREVFLDREYVEIDTPILRHAEDPTDNPVFSTLGPSGWPRFHLRTCPEEYTRRAAAALGAAFEIGKNFRNAEIVSDDMPRRHLPEFTQVEFYQQGNDLDEACKLLQKVIQGIAKKLDKPKISVNGETIDLTGDYKCWKVRDALEETGEKDCLSFVQKHWDNSLPQADREQEAKCLEKLIDKYVRPKLINPTFLIHFPRSADFYPDPDVDGEMLRAEFTIAGMEIGEVAVLQDDVTVLEKHIRQAIKDRHGEKALDQMVDQPYLDEIKELNCQVIGGGFGFDRLLMLLTEQDDIREVVWYPGVSEYFEREKRS